MSQSNSYQLNNYRYFNLFIFLLATFANSIPTQAFSSINSLIQTKFNFRPLIVTLNTLVFPLLHPFTAFPVNWILDRYGVRIGCSIGAVILIAGVWMRTLIQYEQPGWCLVGSILASIGNVFILNSPSIVANNWFNQQALPRIITANVLMNLVSVSIGGSLPGLLVNRSADTNHIRQFFRNEAIMVTVPLVLLIIFLRDKPKQPPSRAAEMRLKIPKKSYRETLKNLLRNKEYIKIVLSMMFAYGSMIAYFSVLDQSLSKLGYAEPGQATSLSILSSVSAGIFSSFAFSYKLKQTLRFKAIISLCLFGAFLTFLSNQVIYWNLVENKWIICASGACLGCFLIPLTSLFTAYSSQTIFPEGEGSGTGYLFAASQTFGFIVGLVMISIIEKGSKTAVILLMLMNAFCYLIACCINLRTKEILNRTEFELGVKREQSHKKMILNEQTEVDE